MFVFMAFDDVSIREFNDPRFRVFADHLCTHSAFVGLYFDVLHWFVFVFWLSTAPRTANKTVEATAGKFLVEVGVLRAVPHLCVR